MECNCPAYAQYWEPCKQIAAVMLKIHDQEQSGFTTDASTISAFFADHRRKQEEATKRRQAEYEKQQEEHTESAQKMSCRSSD